MMIKHASVRLDNPNFAWKLVFCIILFFLFVLFVSSRSHYQHFNEEGVVMNSIGVSLIALAILVGYILQKDDFRFRAHILIRSGDL